MSKPNPEYTIGNNAPELERGPNWLRQQRSAARDDFNAAPLPRRGLHLWRYTDPSQFMFEPSAVAAASDTEFDAIVATELAHLEAGTISGLVTSFAGRDITVHGQKRMRDMGMVVKPLSEAVDSHFDLIQKNLYRSVNSATGKFEALNGALWNDGIFVYVPDNTIIEQPLHLLRQAGLVGSTQYPRLLVIVGTNSELTVIDEYGGGAAEITNGMAYANSAVEIFGGPDSRTQYVSLQRYGLGTHAFQTHRAHIEQGAIMLTIPLAFGAALSKQNFGVVLAGQGAASKMYGLLFGSGRQHFDNHTLHHHTASQTRSDIDFKVVLRDKAISAYTGLIRIENCAKTCEAYQENRNLLLNSGARAETVPELEILNEDVSCSHGATVGPIDEQMIFYLGSRGITRDVAIRMIVSGYVAATLAMVPNDLKERITGFVASRLEGI